MHVDAKFFGLHRQITGADTLAVALPDGADVAFLIDRLNEQFADLALEVERSVVLVNRIKARAATTLHDGDEVFILHLMSGG
jgi:molybdopterin converting factor small subunit